MPERCWNPSFPQPNSLFPPPFCQTCWCCNMGASWRLSALSIHAHTSAPSLCTYINASMLLRPHIIYASTHCPPKPAFSTWTTHLQHAPTHPRTHSKSACYCITFWGIRQRFLFVIGGGSVVYVNDRPLAVICLAFPILDHLPRYRLRFWWITCSWAGRPRPFFLV